MFQPLLEALIGLTFLVVLWVGGYQVLNGRHLDRQLRHVQHLHGDAGVADDRARLGGEPDAARHARRSTASTRFSREQPTIAAAAGRRSPLGDVRGEIEFRGVSVDYGSALALDGVDLRIPAGSTVAVVGHTGSGKSTLVSLIPRLMDPTAGAVLLDGIDLRELDPAELRRQIGFVPQETFLFSATIAENIAFGVDTRHRRSRSAAPPKSPGWPATSKAFPKATRPWSASAASRSRAGRSSAPRSPARILRDPRILILDDALSSVDTLTEERILTHLAGVMRGRTVILISHRVSTVRQADRIVVLSNAAGSSSRARTPNWSSAGGYYAELSQKQMLEEELESI